MDNLSHRTHYVSLEDECRITNLDQYTGTGPCSWVLILGEYTDPPLLTPINYYSCSWVVCNTYKRDQEVVTKDDLRLPSVEGIPTQLDLMSVDRYILTLACRTHTGTRNWGGLTHGNPFSEVEQPGVKGVDISPDHYYRD